MIVHVTDHRRHPPVVPEIAHCQATPRVHRRDSRSSFRGNIIKRPISVVVIQNAWLWIRAPQVLLVHFRVDVPIHNQQIGPAIVVEIQKASPPSQILSVQAQPRRERHVVKCPIPVVPVKRGGVIRKVGLEYIEPSIPIEVCHANAHSRLLASIFVIGRARADRDIGERPIVIVAKQHAGRAVAGNIDVGPTIVIEIKGGHAQRVMTGGLIDVRLSRYVHEFPSTHIVIENVLRSRQSARPAHHGNSLPHTRRALARGWRFREIEIYIVGYDKVQLSIAVVIQE